MAKTKLWIVTELFYPDMTSTAYILSEIAKKYAECYDVQIICGPIYNPECLSKDKYDAEEITIQRVKIPSLDKNRLSRRLIRSLLISLKLSYRFLKLVKKGDKVFIVTNPATLVISTSIIKYFKNFNLTILVHDIFPENTIPAGLLSSQKNLIYRLSKYLFNKAYSSADQLIVLDSDMKKVMLNKIGKERQNNITIIPNWADNINIVAQYQYLFNNKFIVQYAGNYGRVQGLMELISVIKDCSNDNLKFEFYGNGALKESLENFIKRNDLKNVSINGAYRRESQNRILNHCSLAIVSLASGMKGLGVPSKIYNILAAGKPILYIGDINCDVAKMIEKNHIGFCFDLSERNKLISFLDNLSIHAHTPLLMEMGKNARILAETIYSKENILNSYLNLL